MVAEVDCEWYSSLAGFSDDVLDEITADGHVFANTGWYRVLDQVDFSRTVGGESHLRYLIAHHAGKPIAICPVLACRGHGTYFVYHLRRYYFEHWIEDAVRLHPDKRTEYARLFSYVSRYAQLLSATGCELDRAWIVGNPLSYRGVIPIDPSAGVPRFVIHRALVRELKRAARRHRVPLVFLAVPQEDTPWRQSLERAGCTSSFLFADNVIDLTPFRSFDDYLQSFRRTTRRAFARDLKRTAEAGVTLGFVDNFGDMSELMTSLYETTYRRYGESFFRHSPDFWRKVAGYCGRRRSTGTSATTIVARHDRQTIGFSLLLESQRRGETWTYRIGRRDDGALQDSPYYFALSFYGPIRRAIEAGHRRIWLGPAGYETKRVRGATLAPLTNYFWFPRLWDRVALAPYLQLFGAVTLKEIREALALRETPAEPVQTTVRAG